VDFHHADLLVSKSISNVCIIPRHGSSYDTWMSYDFISKPDGGYRELTNCNQFSAL